MNEYIVGTLALDEAKSLAVVKPLHDSFFHSDCPPFFFLSYCLSGTTLEDATKPHRYGERSIFKRVLKQKS
jgi:hypothetical protein